MDYDPRIKLNVFEGNTTYLNDFRRYIPDKRTKHCWLKERKERPSIKSKPFHRIDPETYAKYKNVHVPFNLYIEPRPIIDTQPDTNIPQLLKPVDTQKEEVMKTRPRLYVSPAVGMDDVPDLEMRKLLCQYMYTTESQKTSKEVEKPITQRPIPTTVKMKENDPVVYKEALNCPLPLGWREKGKAWDYTQTRGFVDPTETFWLNKMKSVKCGACVNPFKGSVPKEMKDEIAMLIDKNKLRLAHDYQLPGYAGYKPRIPFGVPLSKTDLPVVHPFLSTSQAITQRYEEDTHS